jgi:hypothetical protein
MSQMINVIPCSHGCSGQFQITDTLLNENDGYDINASFMRDEDGNERETNMAGSDAPKPVKDVRSFASYVSFFFTVESRMTICDLVNQELWRGSHEWTKLRNYFGVSILFVKCAPIRASNLDLTT